jgi:alcohol dehydrogenase
MEFTFNTPGTVIFGGGARKQLPAQLRALGARKVLVVTDANLARMPMVSELISSVAAEGFDTAVFDGVEPDPTDRHVAAGVERFHAAGAEVLVAIGGGSPMDCAKMIGASSANPGPLSMFQGIGKVAVAGPPLISVPTTAGTGSEVTRAAVITDTSRDVKMLILDAKLMSRAAIVDYELTLTMPKDLTANVGVDTLVHGVEAYVSRRANPVSDVLALASIGRTAKRLRTAWREPDNHEAREAMAMAAYQAGMAFTNSSVCLVHGMSRPIGALFHLPHGLSNAVLFPAVTRFSIAGAPGRYGDVARAMGLASTAELAPALEKLNRDLGIPRFGECLGGDRNKLDAVSSKMASDALASGSPQNNPVIPTVEQIVELYQEAW